MTANVVFSQLLEVMAGSMTRTYVAWQAPVFVITGKPVHFHLLTLGLLFNVFSNKLNCKF